MVIGRSNMASLFIWVFVSSLLSQSLLIPVLSTSLEDQKHQLSPTGKQTGSQHDSKCNCSPPPAHHRTHPSHGGGVHNPVPSTPGSSGGTHIPPPSPPSGGGHGHCDTPPPKRGHGGSSHSPPSIGSPTPVSIPPPTTPIGTPPSIGSPPTPVSIPPPTTPIGTPTTPPGSSVPSPPFVPDPNTPTPGTCIYWRNHPTLIWGLFGWFATVGGAFGLPSTPGSSGAGLNLLEALSNTRTDGLGALYREGTASLLNSMVNRRFHFTTAQVRDSFLVAAGSDKAAAAQARIFKLANEGRLKPRA